MTYTQSAFLSAIIPLLLVIAAALYLDMRVADKFLEACLNKKGHVVELYRSSICVSDDGRILP